MNFLVTVTTCYGALYFDCGTVLELKMLPGYTGRYVIHSLDTNGLDIHRSKLKLVQREKKNKTYLVSIVVLSTNCFTQQVSSYLSTLLINRYISTQQLFSFRCIEVSLSAYIRTLTLLLCVLLKEHIEEHF